MISYVFAISIKQITATTKFFYGPLKFAINKFCCNAVKKKKKNTKVSTHIFKDFINNFIYQKNFHKLCCDKY